MSHRIVLVDDHEIVRQGVRRVLEDEPDMEIVGEAATVDAARGLFDQEPVDVAILDVVLADGDGVQLCREILSDHPDTACILLTSFPEPRAMLSAALAGASAYLVKDSDAADVVSTVRKVAEGARLLDRARIAEILDELASQPQDHPLLAGLTVQEWRVFELVGQGLSNRQIASQMHLAERTIKNYVSRMLGKLDMDRRTEAAVLAARLAERRAQEHARDPGPRA